MENFESIVEVTQSSLQSLLSVVADDVKASEDLVCYHNIVQINRIKRVVCRLQAARKCFDARSLRERATVNFIVVDWAGRTHGANRIGEVAKRRNIQNVRFFLKRDMTK